jgi:hypothetical protein
MSPIREGSGRSATRPTARPAGTHRRVSRPDGCCAAARALVGRSSDRRRDVQGSPSLSDALQSSAIKHVSPCLSRLAASSAGAVGICRIAMVVADHEPTPVRQGLVEGLVLRATHDPALHSPPSESLVLLELLHPAQWSTGIPSTSAVPSTGLEPVAYRLERKRIGAQHGLQRLRQRQLGVEEEGDGEAELRESGCSRRGGDCCRPRDSGGTR